MANTKITKEELSVKLLEYLTNASNIKVTDDEELFTGDTLDKILVELKNSTPETPELSAQNVTFDDATTQLGAANLQEAIVKIVEMVGQATTQLNEINTALEADIGTPK